jgi:hypothetical protein
MATEFRSHRRTRRTWECRPQAVTTVPESPSNLEDFYSRGPFRSVLIYR